MMDNKGLSHLHFAVLPFPWKNLKLMVVEASDHKVKICFMLVCSIYVSQ